MQAGAAAVQASAGADSAGGKPTKAPSHKKIDRPPAAPAGGNDNNNPPPPTGRFPSQPDENSRPPEEGVHYLGRFDPSRVTGRDAAGRITEVDGVPVNEVLRRVARARAEAYHTRRQAAKQRRSELQKEITRLANAVRKAQGEQKTALARQRAALEREMADLWVAKRGEDVLAVVVDARTGDVFEATNATDAYLLGYLAWNSVMDARLGELWGRHFGAAGPVTALLHQMLRDGRLRPGTMLDATVLGRELGIDPDLVRTALTYLARSGVLVPQKQITRFLVPEPGQEPVIDRQPGDPDHDESASEFPWTDTPARHAEIRAVTEILNINEGTTPADLIADVWNFGDKGPQPMPFCSNCSGILHDVHSNSGPPAHNDRVPHDRHPPPDPTAPGADETGDNSAGYGTAPTNPGPPNPGAAADSANPPSPPGTPQPGPVSAADPGAAPDTPNPDSTDADPASPDTDPHPTDPEAARPSSPDTTGHAPAESDPDAASPTPANSASGSGAAPGSANPAAAPGSANPGSANADPASSDTNLDPVDPEAAPDTTHSSAPNTTGHAPAGAGVDAANANSATPATDPDPASPAPDSGADPGSANPATAPDLGSHDANPGSGPGAGPDSTHSASANPTTGIESNAANPGASAGPGSAAPISANPAADPDAHRGSTKPDTGPDTDNDPGDGASPAPGPNPDQPVQPSGGAGAAVPETTTNATTPPKSTQDDAARIDAGGPVTRGQQVGGRVVNADHSGVPSVPHSGFFAQSGGNSLMRNVVEALARAAMTATTGHADPGTGLHPYSVAKDAGISATDIRPLGNGRFLVKQADGTTMVVTVEARATRDGNLADLTMRSTTDTTTRTAPPGTDLTDPVAVAAAARIDAVATVALGPGAFRFTGRDGKFRTVTATGGLLVVATTSDTATITVSPTVGKDQVARTLANALAQVDRYFRGASTTGDLLTSARHPGAGLDLSTRDHGREGEVRNVDRTGKETSRLRIARRRRIAAEMRALVEAMGVHEAQDGGPDRRALLSPDVRAILDGHAPADARRPSWVATGPTGLAGARAYPHELAAQSIPGLSAAAAIIATSLAQGQSLWGGIGVGVVTLGSAVAGTYLKFRMAPKNKELGDANHEHAAAQRDFEANQRRAGLLDSLFGRSRTMAVEVGGGPAEPAPRGEAPATFHKLRLRLLTAAGPQAIGALLAAPLIHFGLPPLAWASQAAVAALSSVTGPLVDRYLKPRELAREVSTMDAIGRRLEDLAYAADVKRITLLHQLFDRIDALAGAAPAGQAPAPEGPLAQHTATVGALPYLADAASGQLGNWARALEGLVTAKAGTVELTLLRFVVGTVGTAALNSSFNHAELLAAAEQAGFDFSHAHLNRQEAVDAVIEAVLDRVDQHLTAAEQRQAMARRVADSGQDRAVDLRRGHDADLAASLPAERPPGWRGAKAMWAFGVAQNAMMGGAMAVGVSLFGTGDTALSHWGGVIVVGSAGVGGIVATWHRIRFKRAELAAAAEEVAANEAKDAAELDAAAQEDVRFYTEFFQAEADAAAAGTPRPPAEESRIPFVVGRGDPRYADYVADRVAAERATLARDPRPYSLRGARMRALARLERQVGRLRNAMAHAAAEPGARADAILDQAGKKLAALWSEYQRLVLDGTPVTPDDESPPGRGPTRNGPRRTGPPTRAGEDVGAAPDADPDSGTAPDPDPGTTDVQVRSYAETGVRPTLDARQQELWDAGIHTPNGRAYFTEEETALRESALSLAVVPGMYTFDIHGTPDAVWLGGEELSVEDAAVLIENDPYFTGQPVWLFSCETGKDTHGFAQQLADRLGVEVVAPDQLAGTEPDGTPFTGEGVFDEHGVLTGTVRPPNGFWFSHYPTDLDDPGAEHPGPSEHVARIDALSERGGRGGRWWGVFRSGTQPPPPVAETAAPRRHVHGRYIEEPELPLLGTPPDVVAPPPPVSAEAFLAEHAPEPAIHSSGVRLWPDELADVVAGSAGWTGGPVRLGIQDGVVDGAFLQRLADLLGVTVAAPVDVVIDGFPRCSTGTLTVHNGPVAGAVPDAAWRVVPPRNATTMATVEVQ